MLNCTEIKLLTLEPIITPSTTPILSSALLTSTSSLDEPYNNKIVSSKPPHKRSIRRLDKSHHSNNNYGSPESPLSKMDIMSPPAHETIDGLLSPKNITQLEIPTPERLLPIGQYGKEGLSQLAERVREALTIPDISHLKQDHDNKSESSTTRGDITPNSRGNSPRKLTKQVALESPPNVVSHHGTDELYSTMSRAVAGNVKIDKPSTARDETYRTQRQRLRKVGPFAIGSQSIPDSVSKFAGAWAPNNQNREGDSDADDGDTIQQGSHTSSEMKAVLL